MTAKKEDIKRTAEKIYEKYYGKVEDKDSLQSAKPVKTEEVKAKIPIEKMALPKMKLEGPVTRVHEDIEKENMNIIYPLIPRRPKKGEPIFAYAKISWNDSTQSFVYHLIEPYISPENLKVMERIKDTLEEKLDIDFTQVSSDQAEEYLGQKIDEIITFLELGISEAEKQIILYFIKRDFIGLGTIEPLMRDPYIEDISCDGNNVPIFVYHRNPIVGSIPTDVIFNNKDKLDVFVQRLAQKSGKSISVAEPLIDASLPDGSRLQATLSTDIARRGSNFTIRRFTEKPLSPTDLIDFGALDSRLLAYLWFCIENRKSMLISGGTATGKTTFLNVLSMLIKPEAKIVSIEDTPELRLSHPHWVPEVAREAISTHKGEGYGSVDLFDLLRSSLRQRPDYIIVGEVRGKEAYVLFQQIATGHTGLSTIHAENMEKLIDRLTTEPINLSASLLESLDLVVFLKSEKRKEGSIRRVNEVFEIMGFDREKNYPIFNRSFFWDPKKEIYDSEGSNILKYISEHTRMGKDEINQEIIDRTNVFEWLRKKNIKDYRDVTNIITMYYNEKEALMNKIDRDME